MGSVRQSPGSRSPGRAVGGGLAAEIFDVIADRLAARVEAIALFAETGRCFQGWCVWEAMAACRGAGWTAQPEPAYADVGVAGSRECGDLLVFDPASGRRVLLELALIHDWTTNKWIDELNGDTDRLARSPVTGLQIIVAASLPSPVEVNATWQGWLGMSDVWNRPTDLGRSMRLGPVGGLLVKGWMIGDE